MLETSANDTPPGNPTDASTPILLTGACNHWMLFKTPFNSANKTCWAYVVKEKLATTKLIKLMTVTRKISMTTTVRRNWCERRLSCTSPLCLASPQEIFMRSTCRYGVLNCDYVLRRRVVDFAHATGVPCPLLRPDRGAKKLFFKNKALTRTHYRRTDRRAVLKQRMSEKAARVGFYENDRPPGRPLSFFPFWVANTQFNHWTKWPLSFFFSSPLTYITGPSGWWEPNSSWRKQKTISDLSRPSFRLACQLLNKWRALLFSKSSTSL